jgi:hypothetical protein
MLRGSGESNSGARPVASYLDIFPHSYARRVLQAWRYRVLDDTVSNLFFGGTTETGLDISEFSALLEALPADDYAGRVALVAAHPSARDGLLYEAQSSDPDTGARMAYGALAVGLSEKAPVVGAVDSEVAIEMSVYCQYDTRSLDPVSRDASAMVDHFGRLFWSREKGGPSLCTDLFLNEPGNPAEGQRAMVERPLSSRAIELGEVVDNTSVVLSAQLRFTWATAGDAWRGPIPVPEEP